MQVSPKTTASIRVSPLPSRGPTGRVGHNRPVIDERDTESIIDWLAVWEPVLDRCFYVPASELGTGMNYLTLRLRPSRNNQIRGIRLAERYTTI